MRENLEALTPSNLPGLRWLTTLLDRLVFHAGVRMEGNLVLFRKTLLTLEGVILDLLERNEADRDRVIDAAATRSFLSSLFSEWPARVLAPLNEKDFPSRLSSSDLVTAAIRSPAAASEWWTRSLCNFWRQFQACSAAN